MRYLGLDFGHKKIGVALSDERGDFVYPYSVIPTAGAEQAVLDICTREGAGEIVMGDTKDLGGGANPVSERAEKFAEDLKQKTNLPLHFQTEVFTSREAERIIGDDEMRDARAAAIILQSFLDLKRIK
ncbi:MAG: Holliday junction resolvase RuvX [Candidatus Vogelbacteria bacterium]|nr:Holliday junction resolvase RuvX [Candidatus Vogelbacteria bacterium]